jgi:hypothetical protein
LGNGSAGSQRQYTSDQERQQGGAGHGALCSADDLIDLIQTRGNADDAWTAGHSHI